MINAAQLVNAEQDRSDRWRLQTRAGVVDAVTRLCRAAQHRLASGDPRALLDLQAQLEDLGTSLGEAAGATAMTRAVEQYRAAKGEATL